MHAPCSTRTIGRHLNKEKIKHKKRIHRPRLTIKHKEKPLKYARQYQTMSAKEWRKVVFSNEKKFNLNGPNGFLNYWLAKNFPKENYSRRLSGKDLLRSGVEGFSSSGKFKLQFVSGQPKAAGFVKLLNDFSLAQEERHLRGQE